MTFGFLEMVSLTPTEWSTCFPAVLEACLGRPLPWSLMQLQNFQQAAILSGLSLFLYEVVVLISLTSEGFCESTGHSP